MEISTVPAETVNTLSPVAGITGGNRRDATRRRRRRRPVRVQGVTSAINCTIPRRETWRSFANKVALERTCNSTDSTISKRHVEARKIDSRNSGNQLARRSVRYISPPPLRRRWRTTRLLHFCRILLDNRPTHRWTSDDQRQSLETPKRPFKLFFGKIAWRTTMNLIIKIDITSVA